jgi:starvation-inducible DNA-binding protein
MLGELHLDNLNLVEALREAKKTVEDAGDNATASLMDDWTDLAEQRAWFLFETCREP